MLQLRKLFLTICFVILTCYSFCSYANQTIDVIFFNDYHGQVLEDSANHIPGMAKFSTAVKELEAKHPNYILVSGGDNYMGPIISNLYYGAPINKMLRYLDVKASAVGNHEFDWGANRIQNYSKDGNFTFVAANITTTDYKTPTWAKPYIIINKCGLKIAFIGLATHETLTTTKTENLKQIVFQDNVSSLQKWIDYLKAGKDPAGVPNAIIALTHIPSEQKHDASEIIGDEISALAKNTHGLDAIISAHSHQLVNGKINNIPIIQAGCNGQALGDFTLEFDTNGKLLKVDPELNILSDKINTLAPNKLMEAQANFYHKKIGAIMDRVIGHAAADLEHNKAATTITPLGNFIATAVKNAGASEVAIVNAGGIRLSLGKGPITVGNIYSILPFDNTLIRFMLSGADLKRTIEYGIMNPKMGFSQIAGIKATYDPTKPMYHRLVKIELTNGKPILDDQSYSVTTVDFVFNGGDGYNFAAAQQVERTNKLLRNVVIDAIRKAKVISPQTQEVLHAIS